uniref:hypothetical protein n=1 Tax=Escherichia coli TaxID=562 RepID=UPI001BCC0CF5
IKYRLGCLDDSDRREISEMLTTASRSSEGNCSAISIMSRILLGQTQLARAEYLSLPAEAKSAIDGDPIFKLINPTNEFLVGASQRRADWAPLIEELERELWEKVAKQVGTASNLMPTFPELNHVLFDRKMAEDRKSDDGLS